METGTQTSRPPAGALAEILGWGSLALGMPQITVPGAVARAIGVRDDDRTRTWTMIVGARELAHAVGILALERPRPVRSVWTRVAGDAMDIALLVAASRNKPLSRERLAGAMAAVAGIAAADVYAAVALARAPQAGAGEQQAMRARAAITVRRPREEVYRFWHDFSNLPRFMAHLESVQTADGRSHWKASAPAGRSVEWDAEVVADRPGELIAWRSIGGDVRNEGTVRFVPAPGERGTEIHVDMRYGAPGGALGAAVAKVFGEEPAQQVKDDLRRLKQVLETGDVVRSEGSPEGPYTRRLAFQRPAQHPSPGEGSRS